MRIPLFLNLGRIRFLPFCILLSLPLFGGALLWAKARDPFERISFSLPTLENERVKGMAVIPKEAQPLPIVIYVCDTGGDLISCGSKLRKLAGLGLAAVAIEYDQNNQKTFEQQLAAVSEYLSHQNWAKKNAVAWVGVGLGAQWLLSDLVKNPQLQPQCLVCIAGGWGADLEPFVDSTYPAVVSPIHCPVVLVDGGQHESVSLNRTIKLGSLLRATHVTVTLANFQHETHEYGLDDGMVLREIGEYCKSVLTLNTPFTVMTDKALPSFWICLAPAFVLICFWFIARWKILRSFLYDPWKVLAQSWKWLCGFALGLASLGLVLVLFHLFAPNFIAGPKTLLFASRYLVSDKSRSNFQWLCRKPIWQGQRLGILIEHVKLSDYNRKLINWKLDEQLYRDYVLSPILDLSAHKYNWRRTLWESFYPRIRKDPSPEIAAQTVVRYLRELITIVPGRNTATEVEDIWRLHIADEKRFNLIYVAALRSVGVASRLDIQGQPELWTGSIWISAPRPTKTMLVN